MQTIGLKKGMNFIITGKFKETIECYTEATRLLQNTENSHLAPDDAAIICTIYNKLGNIFRDVARTMRDKSFLQKSFEKYAEAVHLDRQDDILEFNEFLKDKHYLPKGINIFAAVSRLVQYHVYLFNNWAGALFDLAKSTNRLSIVEKELEKFDAAFEKFDNIYEKMGNYKVFIRKVVLYFLLDRKEEAIKCFSTHLKYILRIFAFSDESDRDWIIRKKIPYFLLNFEGTNDIPITMDREFFIKII
jgi:tetratricopeptide (TPR) repeat protein